MEDSIEKNYGNVIHVMLYIYWIERLKTRNAKI